MKKSKLSQIQRDHFDRMTKLEVRATIIDQRKQQDYIAFSGTRAGEKKRAELQRRIDYLEARLRQHVDSGNCWKSEIVNACSRCGDNPCDVCHKHEQPRGECDECVSCLACE